MELAVKFKYFDALECVIQDTELGRKYYDLVKENYESEFPIYRDRPRFTKTYISDLIVKANQHFGWDWDVTNLSLENTTRMHKDVEVLVGDNFHLVPEHLDSVIHDLHYGLHLLQSNKTPTRKGWMQIEWYNDSGFYSDNIQFSKSMEVGDLRLQNPFVGHSPLQIYLERDFEVISQTCKFHTFVKPGINIVTTPYTKFLETDQLMRKFKEHDPEFVMLHGEDKIKSHIGYPVIGKINNLDIVKKLTNNYSPIELESIKFS